MLTRYPIKALLTSLALCALTLGAAPKPSAPCISDPSMLYSRRALRRMRTLLQLRLLELHRERLTVAESLIRHRLSIDDLLSQSDQLSTHTHEGDPAKLKHSTNRRTTTCW